MTNQHTSLSVGRSGEGQGASDDYDDYEDGCYECGGEGFVSDCVEEWACVDPEYGCDYCTRRCPLCNPAKRDPTLDEVLAAALRAQATNNTISEETGR